MATLTQNINSAINSLNEIKTAIINKGVAVPDNTPVSQYATKIGDISVGSSVTLPTSTGWADAYLTQEKGTSSYVYYYTWNIYNTYKIATVPDNMFRNGTGSINLGSNAYFIDTLKKGVDFSLLTKDIPYSDIASLTNIPSVNLTNGTFYTYSLKPIIYVPNGFIAGTNTKVDIITKVKYNDDNLPTVSFKYRFIGESTDTWSKMMYTIPPVTGITSENGVLTIPTLIAGTFYITIDGITYTATESYQTYKRNTSSSIVYRSADGLVLDSVVIPLITQPCYIRFKELQRDSVDIHPKLLMEYL